MESNSTGPQEEAPKKRRGRPPKSEEKVGEARFSVHARLDAMIDVLKDDGRLGRSRPTVVEMLIWRGMEHYESIGLFDGTKADKKRWPPHTKTIEQAKSA